MTSLTLSYWIKFVHDSRDENTMSNVVLMMRVVNLPFCDGQVDLLDVEADARAETWARRPREVAERAHACTVVEPPSVRAMRPERRRCAEKPHSRPWSSNEYSPTGMIVPGRISNGTSSTSVSKFERMYSMSFVRLCIWIGVSPICCDCKRPFRPSMRCPSRLKNSDCQ